MYASSCRLDPKVEFQKTSPTYAIAGATMAGGRVMLFTKVSQVSLDNINILSGILVLPHFFSHGSELSLNQSISFCQFYCSVHFKSLDQVSR
jgi:hypothetical protein